MVSLWLKVKKKTDENYIALCVWYMQTTSIKGKCILEVFFFPD